MRFLIIVIAIFLASLVLRSLLSRATPSNKSKKLNSETMVPCAQCDLHVPKSEAICSDNHFFCGTRHEQEWLEQQKN